MSMRLGSRFCSSSSIAFSASVRTPRAPQARFGWTPRGPKSSAGSSMERMAEVHVPQLDEHDEHDAVPLPAAARPSRTPSIVKIALEVVLIGTGVFLGLAGEQWRESMRHRELADVSLRRFRTE